MPKNSTRISVGDATGLGARPQTYWTMPMPIKDAEGDHHGEHQLLAVNPPEQQLLNEESEKGGKEHSTRQSQPEASGDR